MNTDTKTTAEGHQIIAEAYADGSLIFIIRQANRRTGRALYVVNVAHVPSSRHYIVWSQHDTEAAARESANRLWARRTGRERMLVA